MIPTDYIAFALSSFTAYEIRGASANRSQPGPVDVSDSPEAGGHFRRNRLQ
jgi:hypothetical protein